MLSPNVISKLHQSTTPEEVAAMVDRWRQAPAWRARFDLALAGLTVRRRMDETVEARKSEPEAAAPPAAQVSAPDAAPAPPSSSSSSKSSPTKASKSKAPAAAPAPAPGGEGASGD